MLSSTQICSTQVRIGRLLLFRLLSSTLALRDLFHRAHTCAPGGERIPHARVPGEGRYPVTWLAQIPQATGSGLPTKTASSALKAVCPCFRKVASYLATLRKQGQALLAALETVFADRPLYPAFA